MTQGDEGPTGLRAQDVQGSGPPKRILDIHETETTAPESSVLPKH